MARSVPSALSARLEQLRLTVGAIRGEVRRLRRQELYVAEQIGKARRQISYYEGLLREIRSRLGGNDRLTEMLQRR